MPTPNPLDNGWVLKSLKNLVSQDGPSHGECVNLPTPRGGSRSCRHTLEAYGFDSIDRKPTAGLDFENRRQDLEPRFNEPGLLVGRETGSVDIDHCWNLACCENRAVDSGARPARSLPSQFRKARPPLRERNKRAHYLRCRFVRTSYPIRRADRYGRLIPKGDLP